MDVDATRDKRTGPFGEGCVVWDETLTQLRMRELVVLVKVAWSGTRRMRFCWKRFSLLFKLFWLDMQGFEIWPSIVLNLI